MTTRYRDALMSRDTALDSLDRLEDFISDQRIPSDRQQAKLRELRQARAIIRRLIEGEPAIDYPHE